MALRIVKFLPLESSLGLGMALNGASNFEIPEYYAIFWGWGL